MSFLMERTGKEKLGLALVGRALSSKALTQLPAGGWGCTPSQVIVWPEAAQPGGLWGLLLPLSHFSRVQLFKTPWTAAYRAPRPWDFPGKSTGVGCHCLLHYGSMVGLMVNSKRLYANGHLLVPLSLWWAAADPHFYRRPSNTSR